MQRLTSICPRADYIPVVASVKSLVEIFRKYVLRQDLTKEVRGDRYHHIDKTFLERALLLIPVIGNLAVYFFSSKDPVKTLDQGKSLRFGASILKNSVNSQGANFFSKVASQPRSVQKDLAKAWLECITRKEPGDALYFYLKKCGNVELALEHIKGCDAKTINQHDYLKWALESNQERVVFAIIDRFYSKQDVKLRGAALTAQDEFNDENYLIVFNLLAKYPSLLGSLEKSSPLKIVYTLFKTDELLDDQSIKIGLEYLFSKKDRAKLIKKLVDLKPRLCANIATLLDGLDPKKIHKYNVFTFLEHIKSFVYEEIPLYKIVNLCEDYDGPHDGFSFAEAYVEGVDQDQYMYNAIFLRSLKKQRCHTAFQLTQHFDRSKISLDAINKRDYQLNAEDLKKFLQKRENSKYLVNAENFKFLFEKSSDDLRGVWIQALVELTDLTHYDNIAQILLDQVFLLWSRDRKIQERMKKPQLQSFYLNRMWYQASKTDQEREPWVKELIEKYPSLMKDLISYAISRREQHDFLRKLYTGYDDDFAAMVKLRSSPEDANPTVKRRIYKTGKGIDVQ